jgi:hypothetical protein
MYNLVPCNYLRAELPWKHNHIKNKKQIQCFAVCTLIVPDWFHDLQLYSRYTLQSLNLNCQCMYCLFILNIIYEIWNVYMCTMKINKLFCLSEFDVETIKLRGIGHKSLTKHEWITLTVEMTKMNCTWTMIHKEIENTIEQVWTWTIRIDFHKRK